MTEIKPGDWVTTKGRKDDTWRISKACAESDYAAMVYRLATQEEIEGAMKKAGEDE